MILHGNSELETFLRTPELCPALVGEGAALSALGKTAPFLQAVTQLPPQNAQQLSGGIYSAGGIELQVGQDQVKLFCTSDAKLFAEQQPFNAWCVSYALPQGASYSSELARKQAEDSVLELREEKTALLHEQPIYLLRAAAFIAQTGFTAGEKLKQTAQELAPQICTLQTEKIAPQLERFLLGDYPREAYTALPEVFIALFPHMKSDGNPFSPQRRMFNSLARCEKDTVIRAAVFLRPLAAQQDADLNSAVQRLGLSEESSRDVLFLLENRHAAGVLGTASLEQQYGQHNAQLLSRFQAALSASAPFLNHREQHMR